MAQESSAKFIVPSIRVISPQSQREFTAASTGERRSSLFNRTGRLAEWTDLNDTIMKQRCQVIAAINKTTPKEEEIKYRQQLQEYKIGQEDTSVHPSAEETVELLYNTQSEEEEEYQRRVLKENREWKDLYRSLKEEYLALKEKKKPDSTVSHPQHYLDFMTDKFKFMEQAKGLLEQVELVKEMNDHIVSYTKLRKDELQRETKEMNKMLVSKAST